jgi:myo-inositol-1-phosphate synthase
VFLKMSDDNNTRNLFLLIAGAKGAVGSTVAAAVAVMQQNPEIILPSLSTANLFSYLGASHMISFGGWDTSRGKLCASIQKHGVIPEHIWDPYKTELDRMPIFEAPEPDPDMARQVEHLTNDIQRFKALQPNAQFVFINLLPANIRPDLSGCNTISQLYEEDVCQQLPDLAYTLAAVIFGVPVVNFTPNVVEIQPVRDEALQRGVPLAGRDGKTGQTYFKVALASALKARNLTVDGWYSLNILGNADGENLMDPDRAEGKLSNKTDLLNDILGYPVGPNYEAPAHKVHIDYFPPRGDSKEAWDAIDFSGMFGLPMSLKVNLLGRDSILAAPLVIDLARWVAALKLAGRSGPVPELAFFFKKPVGSNPPLTFQDQIASLQKLERECLNKKNA